MSSLYISFDFDPSLLPFYKIILYDEVLILEEKKASPCLT